MSRFGHSSKWRIAAGLLAALVCGGAAAAWPQPAGRTCCVAVNGDDAGPGTPERPWRTLAKAAAAVEPGMTVVVRGGTYRERLVLRRSGTPSARIVFLAQPGESVTIDGRGIAFANPLWNGLIDIDRQSHITISGFTVVDSASTGIFAVYCEDLVLEKNRTVNTAMPGILAWYCRDLVIDGNDVDRACTGGGLDAQEAVSVGACDAFRVSNNIVHGGPTEGIDAKMGCTHGTIQGNEVYGQTERVGIYVDAWEQHQYDIEVCHNVSHGNESGFAVASESGGLVEKIRVHDNVAYDNRSAGFWVVGWNRPTAHPLKDIWVYANRSFRNRWGFQVFASDSTRIEGVRLVNNLVYANTDSGIAIAGASEPSADFLVSDLLIANNTIHGNGVGRQWDSGGIHLYNLNARGVVIRNNILSDNSSFSIAVEAMQPPRSVDVIIDHNLIEGYRGYWKENRGSDAIMADPRFADAGSADFHLRAGSAAIDAGSTVGAPELDFEGRPRPRGKAIDIGAYEYP
jgi:hypothetical protein